MNFKKIIKQILNENYNNEFDEDVIQFSRMGSGFIEAPMILKFINYLKKNKTEILNRVNKQKNKNESHIDNIYFATDIFNEYSKEKYNKTYRNVKIYSTEEKKIAQTIFKIIFHEQRKWA